MEKFNKLVVKLPDGDFIIEDITIKGKEFSANGTYYDKKEFEYTAHLYGVSKVAITEASFKVDNWEEWTIDTEHTETTEILNELYEVNKKNRSWKTVFMRSEKSV